MALPAATGMSARTACAGSGTVIAAVAAASSGSPTNRPAGGNGAPYAPYTATERTVIGQKELTIKPYFQDAAVTLYHGDCRTILPDLGKGSVDFICTDPPYGMTDCEWDTTDPLDLIWPLLRRLLTPTGSVAMTASQPFTSALVQSNLKAFKTEWIWEKNAGSNFGTVKRQPMKEHESVLVFAWATLPLRANHAAPRRIWAISRALRGCQLCHQSRGILIGRTDRNCIVSSTRLALSTVDSTIQPGAGTAPDAKASRANAVLDRHLRARGRFGR